MEIFRGCTDLQGRVSRRLQEADPLPQRLRDQCHEWLAAAHGEVRLIEDRDLGAGTLTWRELDDTILQQRGIAWVSDDVLLARAANLPSSDEGLAALGFRVLFRMNVVYDATDPGGYERNVRVVSATGADPTDSVAQILGLLGAQLCEGIQIHGSGNDNENFCVPAVTLSRFLDLSTCDSVYFDSARFSQDQCLALSHWRRTLAVNRCTLEDVGRSIFDKVERNEGPTKLALGGTEIDTRALAKALRMSTSMSALYIREGQRNFDMPRFLSALEQNCGLLWLALDATVVEPFWFDLFRSLGRHPTLLRLTLALGAQPQYAEDRVRETRAIADMMETNKTLQEIAALPGQVDETIMQNEVVPRLRVNVFRPRIKALEEVGTDREFQRRLVGAALMHERDPTAMWMLVSAFHSLVAEQYGETQERLSAGPVAGRTRSRNRRREH